MLDLCYHSGKLSTGNGWGLLGHLPAQRVALLVKREPAGITIWLLARTRLRIQEKISSTIKVNECNNRNNRTKENART